MQQIEFSLFVSSLQLCTMLYAMNQNHCMGSRVHLMVDPGNNHENDTTPSDGGFISARPWVMDYVDVNGLSNRIGLPKDRFIEFIVKETVDNALDFMEKEAPRLIKKYGAFVPEVKIIVTKESNYLRIRILNSDCETSGFTKHMQYKGVYIMSSAATSSDNNSGRDRIIGFRMSSNERTAYP